MKKLLIALLMLLSASSLSSAEPIDLSNRNYMVNAIAAQIISGQPYCWGEVTPADKSANFARLYGHDYDAKFTKDVIAQIGVYIDLMGKSVQNYRDICNYGILVHLRIYGRVR